MTLGDKKRTLGMTAFEAIRAADRAHMRLSGGERPPGPVYAEIQAYSLLAIASISVMWFCGQEGDPE